MSVLSKSYGPELRAGKQGIAFDLTEDLVEFFLSFTEQARSVAHKANTPTELLHELRGLGWVRTADNYGQKAHVAFPTEGGEYRITVIAKEKGGMQLQYRWWYRS